MKDIGIEQLREHCVKNGSVTITSEFALKLLSAYEEQQLLLSGRVHFFRGVGGAMVWASLFAVYLLVFRP